MKLHYFHGRGPLRALVLIRQRRRLELHIKPVGEQAWALVAMSGEGEHQPDRQRCQGPYRSIAQAEAALRGAAGALLETGYQAQPDSHVVWSVVAQRLARGIRQDRDTNEGRYQCEPGRFDPGQFDPEPSESLDR